MKNIVKYACATVAALIVMTTPAWAATYQGVDIAHYASSVDFNVLKNSGHGQFVYIKTSEGYSWRDPKWQTFTAGAQSAGIPFGYYHYFCADEDGAKQADVFWNLIKGTGYTLVPAVDVEETYGEDAPVIQSSLRAFVDRFYVLSGRKPMIYASTAFINEFIGSGFTDCALWQAHYASAPGSVVGWGHDYTAWQYSGDKAYVAGIDNPADLDIADDRIFTGTPSVPTGQPASPYPYIIPVVRGDSNRRAVRTSASWSAGVIGHISIGDRYEIMGPTNSKGWVQIGLCGRAIGYVSAYCF